MKRIEHQDSSWLLAVGFMSSVFLSGCAVGPNYKAPHTTVAGSFANSPTNAVSSDEAALATWWRGFNDVRLDGLVERAIAHNHDLRIATANLKEARALRRLSTFDLAPTVQGNAGYQNSLLSPTFSTGGRMTRKMLSNGERHQKVSSTLRPLVLPGSVQ